MTKKDYELIAGVFNANLGVVAGDFKMSTAIKSVARGLAINLGASNPRFDRNKFLIACGVEQQLASGYENRYFDYLDS